MDVQKLTLFFNDDEGTPQIDNGLFRRDLDPETAPILDDEGNALWVIGRGKHANIVFNSLLISRRHAYIRCWAVESRNVWQIRHDLNARNHSYKDTRDGIVRLPDQWLNIHDYDQFFFADNRHGFVCTTAPNDTMQNYDDTDVGDEGPPTINETMEKAIADQNAPQQRHKDEPWYSEAFRTVWQGPDGIPDWIWQTGMVAIVVVLALEWIRGQ